MDKRPGPLTVAAFLLVIVVILFFVIEEKRVASTFGFPLDDAWIFWVFAKNFATGGGFSFNPGEPVLGVTSVLWVLILAFSYLLSQDVVLVSKLLGVAFFLGTVVLAYRICLSYAHRKKIALLGVVTFATIPPLIGGVLSGMEVSLASFLLISTLFFHVKKKEALALLFCALSFMARPELIVLFPLLMIDDRLNKEKTLELGEDHKRVSSLWQKVFLFTVFLSPYFLFNFFTAQSLLPNTFAAKTCDSGLVWGIGNNNLAEILTSVTLDPYVWVGSTLSTLVFLNVFWAFFWGAGLIFSLLHKKSLIYPLIFLLVPMARGISAPVGSPFLGGHRYVSFLFPILAIFFVIGWEQLKARLKTKIPIRTLKRWLLAIGSISLFFSFLTYLNPLVKKQAILSLFPEYYFPSLSAKDSLASISFSEFQVMLWFSVFFIVGAGYLTTSQLLAQPKIKGRLALLILLSGLILQTGFLINRAGRHGLCVKNINDMHVHLGKWTNQHIPAGALVAINDVGAIKFFGKRKCLDLEGLVYPHIIPYKILGKESYILYLNKHRPDYFIIFPSWYSVPVRSLRLLDGIIYQVTLKDNLACGGEGHMIVAQPDWEHFDSLFQETGLLEIKTYAPPKSFKRRWYDAQEHMGLTPDWLLYFIQGDSMEKRGNLKEAEKLYLKAASFSPGHYELHLQLALLYKKMGDQSKTAEELEKVIKERFFPPPDFRAPDR